jgi:uncharacterized protein YndB with AHSA1/START domain
MSDADGLEVAIHIEARPETVFEFFVDPAKYVEWMGSDATIEPVPGGTYRVHMRDGVETAGTFVEIDAPHRLVFRGAGKATRSSPPARAESRSR